LDPHRILKSDDFTVYVFKICKKIKICKKLE
jgi:hypothetical protein